MSDTCSKIEECVLELYKIGAVKFGNYKLKSGIFSPVYIDLRVLIGHPKLLEIVADLMWEKAATSTFDQLCGVPYTALPIATIISLKQTLPMIMIRKEAKNYGTKKMIEGIFKENDMCLIIEDVIVSGSSVYETAEVIKNEKMQIKEAIVFINREQGGVANLEKVGIKVSSVLTLTQIMDFLKLHEKIDDTMVEKVLNFINTNNDVKIPEVEHIVIKNKRCMFRERSPMCVRAVNARHPVTIRLFSMMHEKRTNLCVAADVETTAELLKLADAVGPYICILKTHVDTIKDFTSDTIENLKELATKHQFLLFEDRKFGDIGKTVQDQYSGGIYQISKWADIVTVHGLSGPGVLEGLKAADAGRSKACVIVAEMSSDQNLIDVKYTQACVAMANVYEDLVIGFVSQGSVSSNANHIIMTPGVSLCANDDALGQRYKSPETAICDNGADIIIVGRGITKAADPANIAEKYKEAAYEAMLKKLLGEV